MACEKEPQQTFLICPHVWPKKLSGFKFLYSAIVLLFIWPFPNILVFHGSRPFIADVSPESGQDFVAPSSSFCSPSASVQQLNELLLKLSTLHSTSLMLRSMLPLYFSRDREQSCSKSSYTNAVFAAACQTDELEFNKNCYFIEPRHRSWHQAQRACDDARNSTLVQIESEAENVWLVERLRQKIGMYNFTWIGLRRVGPAKYQWINGSSPQHWGVDKLGGFFEFLAGSCISLVPRRGTWVRSMCESEWPSVCERSSNAASSLASTFSLDFRLSSYSYCLRFFASVFTVVISLLMMRYFEL